MGARGRHWLIVLAVVFALLAAVAAAAWLMFGGRPKWSRADVLSTMAIAVAIVGVIGGVFGAPLFAQWLEKRSSNAQVRSGDAELAALDVAADLLARAVKDQWTRAAAERRLFAPTAIPVQWRRSMLPVAGPVSESVASKQLPARFSPLPGLPATTAAQLRSGQLRDLHAIYGGLGSGRLVIVGRPGSGKTSAAVLLVLAALAHREQVADEDRPRVPVPVLLTLQGWDASRQRFEEWLVTRLAESYPQFAGKRGAATAGALIARSRLAVILDGLDEIGETLRPVALRALSDQAVLRIVVLTRSAEMVEAASEAHFIGAAAIELQDLDARVAADYLTRAQIDPPPRGWSDLVSRLRRAPNSPLAEALRVPLMLTLLRDTYRGGDDLHALLDLPNEAAGHEAQRQHVESYLLDRVLPAAYQPRPGDPPARYEPETAERSLRYIAQRMTKDGTRDLRWWLIPDWAPSARRIIIVSSFGWGLAAGLVGGLAFGLWAGLALGLFVGLLAFGLDLQRRGQQQLRPLQSRRLFEAETLGYDLRVGLVAGLVGGLTFGLVGGLGYGLAVGLSFGVGVVGLVAVGERSLSISDDTRSLSPIASWRATRRYGLVYGLVLGVAVLPIGLRQGLAFGLVFGLAVGLVSGLVYPQTWPSSLAFLQIARQNHLPVRLIRFLEDAHRRGVLRTVGPAYQFRHARLQDHLAEPEQKTR